LSKGRRLRKAAEGRVLRRRASSRFVVDAACPDLRRSGASLYQHHAPCQEPWTSTKVGLPSVPRDGRFRKFGFEALVTTENNRIGVLPDICKLPKIAGPLQERPWRKPRPLADTQTDILRRRRRSSPPWWSWCVKRRRNRRGRSSRPSRSSNRTDRSDTSTPLPTM
jgi:hypothetical protein